MKATIKDRIIAHRSAPDVYDPPSFEQMADRIEELEANLAKAVAFIKGVKKGPEWGSSMPNWVNEKMAEANTTIEELTGGKDANN